MVKGNVSYKKPTKKKKSVKLSTIKKKADAAFSLFIRERDGGRCVVCGTSRRIQCGHLIKRGKLATRYSEINCHALCATCNFRDQFEPQHYICWFLKKYGSEVYQALVAESRTLCQMKRQDYENIINYYQILCKKKT